MLCSRLLERDLAPVRDCGEGSKGYGACRKEVPKMKYLVGGFLIPALLFGTARLASAGCDLNDPTTKAQVDAARAAADQACDQKTPPAGCTTAASHGQYVSCVAHEANANTSLPKESRGAVTKCLARLMCGKEAKGILTSYRL